MLTRRNFMLLSGALFGSVVVGASNVAPPQPPLVNALRKWRGVDLSWSLQFPPLFCTAYLDPSVNREQEAIIARYPLVIVPQNDTVLHKLWRNRLRELNPSIRLLAYQMLGEETTVPGPGHRLVASLYGLRDTWLNGSNGAPMTVAIEPGKYRRIPDIGNANWQKYFVDACDITLRSDQYDGLFLDQCTVFDAVLRARPESNLLAALRTTIRSLRARLPNAIIIGNSSYSFPELNGELNENRPTDLAQETMYDRHQSPNLNLYQCMLKPDFTELDVAAACEVALVNQCLVGVAKDYQHPLWFDIFDDIVAQYSV